MSLGFDFGTANCCVAHLVDGKVSPIPLVDDNIYLPSTLCAPNAESVSEYLFRCLDIAPSNDTNQAVLRRAIKINREEGLDIHADDVKFGHQALKLYLEDPKDVYFVKSPKSFLGAMGLRDMQLSYFEDLVCAMMSNIKRSAEANTNQSFEQTVIGRPVNFLGRGGEASNIQAIDILTRAAKRAGFKDIEFQYEPVAAGLDFEATLTTDQNVLVVDIGGGTTDCSMIQMGPSWQGKMERKESLLAHTGQMVGGNDLDIFIAFRCLMTEFGLGSKLKSGLDLPLIQFWNAIAINDVQAQRDFYAHDNLSMLRQFHKEALEPQKLQRLVALHQETLGHSVIHQAELAKIAMSEQTDYITNIDLVSEAFEVATNRASIDAAIENPMNKIRALVQEAVTQSGIKPDVIYMTGGSSRSRALTSAVASVLPNTEIVSGNYFGSVTAGLTHWANLIYR
ncbi:molecular chaperone [Vibrio panuliri]|uniref:Molecular chaperone n=1 Tax=Vibrio panuliri TaxID=1381081 RepID=A0A1Q9HJT2_9VIBR|nr:molecular chaperone [Vibrio panuliri]OLQ90567.1 molecular chaperone [Vibrio panuliri]